MYHAEYYYGWTNEIGKIAGLLRSFVLVRVIGKANKWEEINMKNLIRFLLHQNLFTLYIVSYCKHICGQGKYFSGDNRKGCVVQLTYVEKRVDIHKYLDEIG